jgi:hypothetical protein
MVSCADERCVATPTGTLGRRKLRGASVTITPGARATLGLRLSAAAQAVARRALAAGKPARIGVRVLVRDAAGNSVTLGRSIALRR